MRTFTFLIFIFLIPWTSLFAQERKSAPQAQRFSLGFKLGPSFTIANYPDETQRDQYSSKLKLGFGAMGFVIFPLGKTRYSFLAEGGYAIRGRKIKLKDGGFINNQTYQFAEMAMSLRRSFDLRIKPNLPSKWFVNVGPNVQYWISGKGTFVTTKYKMKFDQMPTGDIFTNYITGANRWLFGIDVGVGAEAPLSRRQSVRFELRATLGQTFLGKKGSASNYASLSWEDNLKVNLKTFSFTVAYSYDFDMRARRMGKSTKDSMIRRKR